MDIKYTIKDNYLDKEDYDKINNMISGREFPWYFSDTVIHSDDKPNINCFFWYHIFFRERGGGATTPFFKILIPILKKLEIKALIRIKANLYSNQGKIIEHGNHVDYPFKHKSALFFLNTCNGFTTLGDNTKIMSVANRMLFFDASIPHHSSTCTDTKVRININFNYF